MFIVAYQQQIHKMTMNSVTYDSFVMSQVRKP
jgi:hypothetical protein